MKLVLIWPAHDEADESIEAIEAAGLVGVVVGSAQAALSAISARRFVGTVVSLDQPMADEAVLRRIAGVGNAGALVLTSRAPTFEAAVLARRIGAAGVVSEPVGTAALTPFLTEVDRSPIVPVDTSAETSPIVGASPAMAGVFASTADAASSDSTVLLTGESGTGKEVVARTIHGAGSRASGPFVSINCAAIPESLLESELFGHERGAFTGATARRVGRFERADGGTLFLDEIGDMSPLLQAKVLRALEERVVDPVGGRDPRPVDVRVIAATHQDIRPGADDGSFRDGSFREDLYYRLAVFQIFLPPLREREGDVRRLAMHFLRHFAERHGRSVSGITESALNALESAAWPGNVRELRNVLDRAVVMATDGVVRRSDLRLGEDTPRLGPRDAAARVGYPPDWSLARVEADHIGSVLRSVGGQVGRAAEVLGIHRNTLARKLQEYGLRERSGS